MKIYVYNDILVNKENPWYTQKYQIPCQISISQAFKRRLRFCFWFLGGFWGCFFTFKVLYLKNLILFKLCYNKNNNFLFLLNNILINVVIANLILYQKIIISALRNTIVKQTNVCTRRQQLNVSWNWTSKQRASLTYN